MNFSLHDLVPCFYGRDVSDEGGQQDPTEFIETLLFAIDGQNYTDETRKQTATRVIFRTHLRDKALTWYQSLAAGVRGNWESLEVAFLARFALVAQKGFDQTRFLNLVVNFRQKGRSIVEYTREGDKLNAECPEKFRDVLGYQFIAGLDDKRKVDLVQVYLGVQKSAVSYMDARQAVEKAYQRFGEPSPFDDLRSQLSSPPPTPTLQSELVALLQSLRIPQAAPPSRDNLSYRPNYASANSRDQNGRPLFYRDIYCHNCHEEGHYSTSCTRPVVSGAQRNANKKAIDEVQEDHRQYPRGTGMVSGLPPAQSALAIVASAGVGRPEQDSQRMNNIGMANMVILKRPREEEVKSDYADPATVTNSEKLAPTKISKPKDPWPTLLVMEPSVKRIASVPLPFIPLSKDDDMERSTVVTGCRYEMGGVSSLSQEKRIQLDEENYKVSDVAEPMRCQEETLSLPKWQEVADVKTDCSGTKESIPTIMGKGKTRFQVESFHETPVPLPVWQRLDQLPQSKVQLTRAIASSWDFTREEKLAGPTLLGTAAVAAKSYTPPALKPIAHKDKEGYNRLLLKRWTGKIDWGPGAKTI